MLGFVVRDRLGDSGSRWQLVAFVALSVVATAVNGQAATPPTAESTSQPRADSLSPVTITGKAPVETGMTSLRNVVPGTELRRFGDLSIVDALRRIPGLSVTTSSDGTVEIRLRGMGSGYTQILLDGAPPPRGFSIETFNLQLIERIEILRAASAETSAKGIAGTINLVLRKASPKKSSETKMTLGWERERPQAEIGGQISDGSATLRYGSGYSISHESHLRPGTEKIVRSFDGTQSLYQAVTSDALRFDAVSLTPNVSWTPELSTTLSSSAVVRFSELDDVTLRTSTQSSDAVALPNTAFRLSAQTVFLQGAAGASHVLDESSKVEVKFIASQNDRRRSTRLQGSSSDDQPQLDRTITSDLVDVALFSRGVYQRFELWGPSHVTKVGYELDVARRTERVDPVRYALGAGPEIAGDYSATVRTLSFFGQDEWEPNKVLTLNAGLRSEAINVLTRNAQGLAVGGSKTILNPSIQGTLQVDGAANQMQMALARTIKVPPVRQLIPRRLLSNNNSPVEPDYLGNADLHPESAWGLDANWNFSFRKAALSFAGYIRRIQNVIVEQTYLSDGVWTQSPVNFGNATVRGISVDVKYNLKDWSPLAPNVAIKGNVARNWSTVERIHRSNNRIATQTPLTATIGAEYRLSTRYSGGLSYSIQTGGTAWTSDTNSVYAGVRRTLDIYSLARFDDSSRLRLAVGNILGQKELIGSNYDSPQTTERRSSSTATNVVVRVSYEMQW